MPAGRYPCHDLKVHAHTTVLAEPQWGYGGDAGAMLILDSEEADCLLNITGAFGVSSPARPFPPRAARGQYAKERRNDILELV